jgi:phospholipid/cholesterol/gamma-HCH transport system substrate-binding protein
VRRRSVVQVRRYARHFIALVAVIAIGTTCGVLILQSQRLANPFASFYTINGDFPSATAVVGGLGEPVLVAGVRVGQITGTSLSGGVAVIHMQLDPTRIGHIYRGAHADLVPRTPLEDMQVDISPGQRSSGPLPSGATIPVGQTLTPIGADELLDSLDTDTRSWLQSMLVSLGQATSGRGQDIRALLKAFAPTAGQLRELTGLLAARHVELAELVHDFGAVMHAAQEKNGQLRTVVQAGQQVLGALASQDAALRESVAALPGTLTATRTTLSDLTGFADALGPASTALEPTARSLPETLAHTRTALRSAALLPLEQIKPFVSAVHPLTRTLPTLAANLRAEVPALIDSFKVLAYTTNELTYDPGHGNPGFLYWLAWFAHNSNSFISNSDANGPTWRLLLLSSCRGLSTLTAGPLIEQLAGTNFGCGSSSLSNGTTALSRERKAGRR